MASYGVVTANAFDLLSEDGPQQAKKKDNVENKEKKQVKKNAGKGESRGSESQSNVAVPSKDIRGPPNANRRGATGRGAAYFGQQGGRGHTTKRGGRGAHPPRDGKRIFERKSGTGRGREVRKGGYGGTGAVGKWEEEAVVAQETIQAEHAKDATATATTETKAEEVPVEETEEQKALRKEEEEEKKKKTFDQFLAEKKKKSVEADSQLNTREVEVDEKQFKAAKVFAKEDETSEYSALKRENKLKKGKGKAKKNFVSLDEFNAKAGDKQPEGESPAAAAAPAQSRDNRENRDNRDNTRENRDNNRDSRDNRENRDNTRGGGRGRGRGGDRGRGGFRGRGRGRGRGNGREASFVLADDNAFPKLS